MNDWVDYFDNFPEENPANYVGSEFNPKLAEHIRKHEPYCEKKQREDEKRIKNERVEIQTIIKNSR